MYTHVFIRYLYGFQAYILVCFNLHRLYIKISLISSPSLPATLRAATPWSFLSIVRRQHGPPFRLSCPKKQPFIRADGALHAALPALNPQIADPDRIYPGRFRLWQPDLRPWAGNRRAGTVKKPWQRGACM